MRQTTLVLFEKGGLCCLKPLSTVKETGGPGENHRSDESHLQTLSHNVASSTPHLNRIRTHNVSGDRHWLHR